MIITPNIQGNMLRGGELFFVSPLIVNIWHPFIYLQLLAAATPLVNTYSWRPWMLSNKGLHGTTHSGQGETSNLTYRSLRGAAGLHRLQNIWEAALVNSPLSDQLTESSLLLESVLAKASSRLSICPHRGHKATLTLLWRPKLLGSSWSHSTLLCSPGCLCFPWCTCVIVYLYRSPDLETTPFLLPRIAEQRGLNANHTVF